MYVCVCMYVCMYVRMCTCTYYVRMFYNARYRELDLLTRYQQTPKLPVATVPTWQWLPKKRKKTKVVENKLLRDYEATGDRSRQDVKWHKTKSTAVCITFPTLWTNSTRPCYWEGNKLSRSQEFPTFYGTRSSSPCAHKSTTCHLSQTWDTLIQATPCLFIS